ncbi:unnamed protein product [Sphagnum balticum]
MRLITSLLLRVSHHRFSHHLTLYIDVSSELNLLKSFQKGLDPLQPSPATISTDLIIAEIRSGHSHEKAIASKWWEAKAQEMLRTTTNIGKVEVICSLLPMEDEKSAIRLLEGRPDLDMLFALHCRHQELSKEQRTDPA